MWNPVKGLNINVILEQLNANVFLWVFFPNLFFLYKTDLLIFLLVF